MLAGCSVLKRDLQTNARLREKKRETFAARRLHRHKEKESHSSSREKACCRAYKTERENKTTKDNKPASQTSQPTKLNDAKRETKKFLVTDSAPLLCSEVIDAHHKAEPVTSRAASNCPSSLCRLLLLLLLLHPLYLLLLFFLLLPCCC